MDILSHAAAGFAAGHAMGYPITGAIFGILPDLVLPQERVESPPKEYDMTHSLLGLFWFGLLCYVLTGSAVGWVAMGSHILLDLPTHGKTWAPPLLYPFSRKRFSFGEEWEWFNASWWEGATITVIWILACFVTPYLLRGFQS